MTDAPNIHLLADARATIPMLAQWYKGEWSDWFTSIPLSEIEADFLAVAQRDSLPFAVVAFDAVSQPIGVCSIRDEPFEPYPDSGPWLRGLYVCETHRGQGIAGEMIKFASKHAQSIGVGKIYAATHSAIGTFERVGWLGFDQVIHEQQTLTIFAKRLG